VRAQEVQPVIENKKYMCDGREMMEDKNTNLVALQEQETSEGDKPPSMTPRPAHPWRVAVIANVKGETSLPIDSPADAGAEFDRKETIQAICEAIESDGHSTVFLSADTSLPKKLLDVYPDICFNIAEGASGDSREAQVPALLEMLHIPYTASRVMANAIGLDKTMTKRVWREQGLPTAAFQEFVYGNEPLDKNMHFPMFVKPAREGTGMGMDSGAICFDEDQLRTRVNWVVKNYHQPALVEEFLPGREFTIAVMGRPDAALYSPHPEWYQADGFHRFPVLEIDNEHSVTPGVYGNIAKTLHNEDEGVPGFICPAPVDADLAYEMRELAIKAHLAVGAVDVSRVDMRLDAEGHPRLIEINTLPGLTPDFSDLCVIAKAEKISYRDLIREILYLGASRFGMLTPCINSETEPIRLMTMPEYVPARMNQSA
jgi:D-alanine-D-alanine ligase